jgi:hypothetical protein
MMVNLWLIRAWRVTLEQPPGYERNFDSSPVAIDRHSSTSPPVTWSASNRCPRANGKKHPRPERLERSQPNDDAL